MHTASSAKRTCSALASAVGVDGDGADAQLAAGADDAERDLAAVGDEDLLEHRRRRQAPARSRNSGWPNSTGCPFSTRISATLPGHLGLDLVHQLHRLDDAEDLALLRPVEPTSTKDGESGAGVR